MDRNASPTAMPEAPLIRAFSWKSEAEIADKLPMLREIEIVR
jgi:hypothetical protein